MPPISLRNSLIGEVVIHRVRVAALAAATVLLLAGCGSEAVTGSAQPASDGNQLFEPCDVSEDALRAAEVTPTVVASTYLDGDDPQWDLCKWSASWYFLTVLSTTHTIDEITANPENSDFTKVIVGDRTAVSYLSTLFSGLLTCDVAYPWARGSVVVRVETKAGDTPEDDPCAVTVRAANALDAALPR